MTLRRARDLVLMAAFFALCTWLAGHSIPASYPKPILDPYVLAHEGGFSHDDHDPGGRTLNGIIQVEDDRYRDERGLPRRLLSAALLGTPEWIAERNEIYELKYWRSAGVRGAELPAGVDYVLFDYGVNSGVGRSGKVLRRILRLPDDDWRITDDILARVKSRGARNLIDPLMDEREAFLRSLRTCPYFCRGWLARTASVRANAKVMAGIVPRSAFPQEQLEPAFGPGKAFEESSP